MEIRSVTLFCEPDLPPEAIRRFATAARGAFPLPVQTIRLATPPFPDWWTAVSPTADTVAAQSLAAGWQAAGIDYASLGPVLLRHDAAWLRRIPTLLAATDSLFASAEIASTTGEIDTGRCLALAGIVRQVSTLRPDGFGNLYLTALAHCPPGSPFFPVAYHAGGPPTFAVAVESADLALAAIRAADTLAAARANLVAAIEMAAAEVTTAANALADRLRLPFAGIDFSLAPYPTGDKSLGGALEALGLPHVGAAGSLFAAGLITEAIARADFPRCGFSGLMLPVLED
ncbi:MAG: DUF711 family protein, partial [Anaerolineales bacterium]|nr:DUF711 family protein [Anaerolineales bacterium]